MVLGILAEMTSCSHERSRGGFTLHLSCAAEGAAGCRSPRAAAGLGSPLGTLALQRFKTGPAMIPAALAGR